MNKKTGILISVVIMITVLITGCSGGGTLSSTAVPDVTPTATPEPSAETSPTDEQTPAPTMVPQSDQPFDESDFASLVGEKLSVKRANGLFGDPVGSYSYLREADGEAFLCIEYKDAYIELTGLPLKLAAMGTGVIENMTDEDFAMEFPVNGIWISKDSKASALKVRGVGIGNLSHQVRYMFKDLNDQYKDNTLYRISDINPAWQEDWTQSFVGGQVESGQDAALPIIKGGENGAEYSEVPVDCDQIIAYTYVDSSADYPLAPDQFNTYASLKFFVKDGTVTGIYLYRFTDPE